jgi:hypothetical protein
MPINMEHVAVRVNDNNNKKEASCAAYCCAGCCVSLCMLIVIAMGIGVVVMFCMGVACLATPDKFPGLCSPISYNDWLAMTIVGAVLMTCCGGGKVIVESKK